MGRQAVILAGGKGSRLAPYTTVLPKPLLPIGDRAILDVVLLQLQAFGFDRIVLAVGHLSHLIRAVIGDGEAYGLEITYHEEQDPLGTVGPLAGIEPLDETFLVMNGDVLTTLDYGRLFDLHGASGNLLTIASHGRSVDVDYGVLRVGEGGELRPIVGYDEKPRLEYIVSMGVYVFQRQALNLVEKGRYMDLPDLVIRLIEEGRPVGSHEFEGYWLDIGRHDDYALATADFERLAGDLLPGSSR